MIVIIWTVAAFGAAYVLGHSNITRGIREVIHGPISPEELDKGEIQITPRRFPVMLLECPGCAGWWLGLGAGFFICGSNPDAVIILISAFYTAGSNFILSKLTKLT